MVEAKALGVQTRKEVVKVDGTKHRTWRSITDVAAECRIEWERRHRTQEAPAAAEDRNADSAAASSSFEPRSRAGGQRAFSRASNDSDPQPNASRGIASLTKEELRKECQRAGIATKIQGFSKKGHKCQVHVPWTSLYTSWPCRGNLPWTVCSRGMLAQHRWSHLRFPQSQALPRRHLVQRPAAPSQNAA